MEDPDVLAHISALVAEEKALRAGASSGHGLDDAAKTRMAHLEVQLDQFWDLLRRRQAREEFGQDPNEEGQRGEEIVEHYQQ